VEPDSRRVINVLQAGRAVAALAVVVHHSATAARDFAGPFPGLQLLRTGQLGVDFFFVLSGFIIYHSTAGNGGGAADYAWSRIRRLYLPYWPVGIGIAIAYLLLPGLSLAHRQWDWLPTLTLAPLGVTALTVAWTLQYEAFFYFAFGLLFFTRMLWLGLALWAAAILAFPDSAIPLALLNLEFMMGIGAAVLYRRGLGHWLLFPAAAALVAAWVAQGNFEGHSPLIGLARACVILQLSLMEERGAFSVPAWLVFLGNASYALYLVHNWIISLVARVVPTQSSVILPAGIAASVAAGIGYYLLFERPVLRAARKWRPPFLVQPRSASPQRSIAAEGAPSPHRRDGYRSPER
jgi:peptidoglycan/LPS O-acetylase OafA/YrhL